MWCRLSPEEREPQYLIDEELLEKIDDFEHDGQQVPASRLGYRITSRFIRRFAGRVFDNPSMVFDDAILQPETQDFAAYADGILYIAEAHQRVARNYLEDGSIDLACPPLRALLHIMAEGTYDGKDVHDPEIRQLFTLESMLQSEWYGERLKTRRQRDQQLWQRHVAYLQNFLSQPELASDAERLTLQSRLETANARLAEVSSSDYLQQIHGCIGADRLQ